MLLIAGFAWSRPEAFPGWWAVLPVVGTTLIIAAGENAWLNRVVLAKPTLVTMGLISYPLYLWHWPLLVLGHEYMMARGTGDSHARTTTIVVMVLSFVLAWLTNRHIERPLRARSALPQTARRRVVALAGGLAAMALLSLVAAESGGFLALYPPEVQPFLTPYVYAEDVPPVDPAKNNAGPLLVTYGDSHADHLRAGLVALQNERVFRVQQVDWGPCPPVANRKPGDEGACRALASQMAELKPDIVLIAALWRQYPHLEGLGETLHFLQQAGVRRIVVMGSVPFWPAQPRVLVYRAFKADPQHRLPQRLPGDDVADTQRADQEVRHIANQAGATFISAHDALCDARGCQVLNGTSRGDIVQIDLSHFSASGSRLLLRQAADAIFGPVATERRNP